MKLLRVLFAGNPRYSGGDGQTLLVRISEKGQGLRRVFLPRKRTRLRNGFAYNRQIYNVCL